MAPTHAVNLTDGLDGLVAGTIVPLLVVLAFIATRQGDGGVTIVTAAVLGVVLGFLLYNRHPAKVFMGDTGSSSTLAPQPGRRRDPDRRRNCSCR